MKALVGLLLVALFFLATPLAAFGATSTMTLSSNVLSYSGQATITYSGTISPAPTVASSVVLTTKGPNGAVDVGVAPVAIGTGSFSYKLVAGGSANWVSGTYTVNGTWGAQGNTATATATFGYSSGTSAMSIRTDAASYSGQSTIIISGFVSPTPTVSSSVVITTKGPSGAVDIGTAAVSTSTGTFTYALVAGGAANWVSGTYTVNGTWGASGTSASASTSFAYSAAASTTSSATVTSTTSVASVTTSTVTPAATSSVSATTTATSTVTVVTTPEFPYSLVVPVFLAALALTFLINGLRRPKAV